MQPSIEVRGEWFVTLESAAECFRVEVLWLEEVHGRGLLGPFERVGEVRALPARQLDRLAAIVRWHRHHGLDLEAVLALLAPEP